ncbi:MAG: hypothetical protein WCP07_05605 [bacterium]
MKSADIEKREVEREMGKRGPRHGATYRKRILTPCMVHIGTERQLRQAQRFNERLDTLLAEWEAAEAYPLNELETSLREQAIEVVALMQSAICDGILHYSVGNLEEE